MIKSDSVLIENVISLVRYIRTMLISLTFSAGVTAAPTNITITSGEWPPYTSEDLPHFGFANHVIEEAFKEVDITITWGFMPWARAKLMAEHGNWLASSLWMRSPDREKLFLYSDSVFEDKRVLIILADSKLSWNTMSDLKGKRLGALIDVAYPYFGPALQQNGKNTLNFPNYRIAFQALLSNRIDGMPAVHHSWKIVLRKHFPESILRRFKASGLQSPPTSFHLIVGKTVPNGEEIISTFNIGLKSLKASGRYDALLSGFRAGQYNQ